MLHPALERWFAEYYDCHRHPTNRLTHKIAIPLIVFHILAMLDWIDLPVVLGTLAGAPYHLSVAHLAFVAAIGWYATMSPKLAAIMAVLWSPLFVVAAYTPWPVVIGIAVFGWIVQLAGHAVWEKKSPAFLTNLLQALIGPLFFVAVLTGDWKMPEERPARA